LDVPNGGDVIERKIVEKLRGMGIESVTGLNLRHAWVENGRTYCNGTVMEEFDLFFSYNAGGQTQYQMFFYEAIDRIVPCLNNYRSFALTEDKLQTVHLLRNHGVPTADFRLCHRDYSERLRRFIQEYILPLRADIRVILIGHKPACAFWRVAEEDMELTSTSQGAT
jgi:ribosomal protein S6--L-glutamate ligase